MKTRLYFAQELYGQQVPDDYIARAIPEIGCEHLDSEFGLKFQQLISLTPEQIIARGALQLMKQQNYDAMLAFDGDLIVGHMAYQQHQISSGLEWRMFNVAVTPEKQKNGICHYLAEELIGHARCAGVGAIRMGKGNNIVTIKIIEKLRTRESDLRIKVSGQVVEIN